MTHRRTQIWALTVVLIILLAGCAPAATPAPPSNLPAEASAGGDLGSSIVGQWRLTGQRGAPLAVRFFEGDAVIWTQDGRNFSGTYRFKQGDLLELDVSGDLGVVKMLLTDVTLTGDMLSFKINANNPALQFERVNQ